MLNNTDYNEAQAKKTSFRKRAIYVLPNLFTTASIFLAFLSMTFTTQGQFVAATYCILIAALMDGIDGKVARLTGTSSEFGVQYDSLADVVAFGVSPAFLFWGWNLNDLGRFGIGVAFIFLACAALRLARFNVASSGDNPQKKFFIGLPSPVAGCTLVTFILFSSNFTVDFKYTPLFLCLIIGLLMVSRVRYFSFKEFDWGKNHPFSVLVMALFIFVLIFSQPDIFMFLVSIAYIASGIIYTFLYIPLRARKNKQVNTKSNENN